ncbi:flagellar basal body-associated protein FliL [Oceanobacillus salinisoli]|uniref:flagellar basal body-associated protein FliL n=1 Tax=Oceanobacillus salinisoli TaxID=2678611 RepID=UPI0012E2CC19|nr:flagellar basal body-associated protein FliL [Oceanobacillus salinisoli]
MSRLVKVMLTSLVVLLIVTIVALVVVLNVTNAKNQSDEPSIDDMIEYSYESPEITTDLEDGSFVRVQFQIVTDGKDAKDEISKRDFQLKNILIKELATMTEEDFKSGLPELEDNLKEKINELMTEGTVVDVYTIDKILQ